MLTLRNPLDIAPTETTGIRTGGLLGQSDAAAPVGGAAIGAAAVGRRGPSPCRRPRAEDVHGRGDPRRQAHRRRS